MKSYPTPEQNPECRCWPNPMKAFFCMTGHMLECHYPLSCREAECSHLARYDDPGEAHSHDDRTLVDALEQAPGARREPLTFDGYPADWPRCACGRPVLDGHLTCGRLDCNEARAREATIIAAAREAVAHGSGHDCGEWWKDGRCQLCDREQPEAADDRPRA